MRWYQIHLTTALLLMLTIGTLMALNFHNTLVIEWQHANGSRRYERRPDQRRVHRGWGWPWVCYVEFDPVIYAEDTAKGWGHGGGFPRWVRRDLFKNIAVGIGLLGIVTITSEMLIRRGKKPVQELLPKPDATP